MKKMKKNMNIVETIVAFDVLTKAKAEADVAHDNAEADADTAR